MKFWSELQCNKVNIGVVIFSHPAAAVWSEERDFVPQTEEKELVLSNVSRETERRGLILEIFLSWKKHDCMIWFDTAVQIEVIVRFNAAQQSSTSICSILHFYPCICCGVSCMPLLEQRRAPHDFYPSRHPPFDNNANSGLSNPPPYSCKCTVNKSPCRMFTFPH